MGPQPGAPLSAVCPSHTRRLCVSSVIRLPGDRNLLCVGSGHFSTLGFFLFFSSPLLPFSVSAPLFPPSHPYVSHLHGVIWPPFPQQDLGAQNSLSRASILIDTQLCFLPGRVLKNHCCQLRSRPHLECVGGRERPHSQGWGECVPASQCCLPSPPLESPKRKIKEGPQERKGWRRPFLTTEANVFPPARGGRREDHPVFWSDPAASVCSFRRGAEGVLLGVSGEKRPSRSTHWQNAEIVRGRNPEDSGRHI